jgi:hypothetical protein
MCQFALFGGGGRVKWFRAPYCRDYRSWSTPAANCLPTALIGSLHGHANRIRSLFGDTRFRRSVRATRHVHSPRVDWPPCPKRRRRLTRRSCRFHQSWSNRTTTRIAHSSGTWKRCVVLMPLPSTSGGTCGVGAGAGFMVPRSPPCPSVVSQQRVYNDWLS